MFNLKEFSVNLADKIAEFIGSWTFIIIQSTILTIWVVLNVLQVFHFDQYPFILLNLFLSFEAAYATPLILMSSNRQAEKDRKHLLHDIELDQEANLIIKKTAEVLNSVSEDIKIDRKAIEILQEARIERAEMIKTLDEIKTLLESRS
jgi:uncharacterized membrane protein